MLATWFIYNKEHISRAFSISISISSIFISVNRTLCSHLDFSFSPPPCTLCFSNSSTVKKPLVKVLFDQCFSLEQTQWHYANIFFTALVLSPTRYIKLKVRNTAFFPHVRFNLSDIWKKWFLTWSFLHNFCLNSIHKKKYSVCLGFG